MSSHLILSIVILMLAASQILIKKGVARLGPLDFSIINLFSLIPRILKSGWMVSSLVLLGISFLIYLFVLSKSQLNITYSIMASSVIVLISAASWFWLKEKLSRPQILGIFLIIFGIFLLTIR